MGSVLDTCPVNVGGSIDDPAEPVGRLLFNVLGMVAELEADLIRLRTLEGMAIAKSKGKLRGNNPISDPPRSRHLRAVHAACAHTQYELAELFDVFPCHRLPRAPAGPAAES
ncbi:recombinase family protein [Pseudarthrobacter albicanus]|uniref:recombinase family protein n=1 Tax=Pseudarthrobacter albicanus TaxID=2823873 RepID=UPI0027DC2C65|nr:recombinase family protein [Pseudarthrobacter albicanus]